MWTGVGGKEAGSFTPGLLQVTRWARGHRRSKLPTQLPQAHHRKGLLPEQLAGTGPAAFRQTCWRQAAQAILVLPRAGFKGCERWGAKVRGGGSAALYQNL